MNSMYYNDYNYKKFMQLVNDKKYFITEIELRETETTHKMHTIKSTDDGNYDFPIEHDLSYEICIEYVNRERPHEFLSELFAFEHGINAESVKETALQVYKDLLKLQYKKGA